MTISDYAPPAEPRAINYNAATRNVRAIITTKWAGGGYTPRVTRKIENYYVDTALDNDSDPWQIEIGDPRGNLLACLERNNEVRMQIFGIGTTPSSLPLLTGIADEVTYGDDGIMRFTGRDFSSIAVDGTVPPGSFRKFQAWRLVDSQAREIGFKRTDLAKNGPSGPIIKKLQISDGSESYWEFWHRMYRKEQMWIWTEPDSTLIAGKLNYESPATYYFGSPRATDSKRVAIAYIPVERLEIRSNKQQRFGEVWVFGHKGDNGFLVKTADPTTRGWIKRPRKIMLDTEAHTANAAMKTAWEEIFESKVGAVEYSITVADPGFEIKQNTIAVLNLKNPDIHGEFFVVGVRTQVGPDGFLQEVRLRERQYAISRRVPQDPKLKSSSTPSKGTEDAGLGSGISSVGNMPETWGTYFVKAANKWHGPWDYNLFLATLIGIADTETGGAFLNERENGGPGGDHFEWELPPTGTLTHGSHGEGGTSAVSLDTWRERFANEAGDGYVSREYGVGTMQLTDRGVKHWADDLFNPGYHDEFQGGRWHPEHNIMAGARFLRTCLQGTVQDSGRDIDMWMGVMAYNRGVAGALSYFAANGKVSPYAISVKTNVLIEPGYLAAVKTAREAAIQQAKSDASATDPGNLVQPASGWQNSPTEISQLLFVRTSDRTVDIQHVDYRLLKRLNSLGTAINKVITVTSGYRYTGTPSDGAGAAPNGHDTQWYLWNRYKNSGFQSRYIAAKPGTSNHEKGEACDCTIGGRPIALVVSPAIMAIYGLHAGVYETANTDPVHVTLIGVNG